jgi:hypothetical protein
MFVTSLCYCNRNLTDGFIPSSVGLGKLRFCDGNPVPAIRELEDKDLWIRCDGGWMVHDYLDFQPSREAVLAERADTRIRVSKHRANARSNAPSNTVTTANVPGTGTGGLEVASDKDIAFIEFWTIYPRKTGKRAARAAFEKALERAPAGDIIAAAERFRDDPNREPQFTPYPTTWLNQDRWEDDPLPARGGGKARSVANILALADGMEPR